jgi:inosine-uridine nucleoside N-ribohydrolase
MTSFLIDTDTAGDDVTSLLFGLLHPDADLQAISVVAGNVYLHEALQNALYTVEIAGRDVPVFAGADRPLFRELVTAHYVHGEDGMGNSHFPTSQRSADDMHAVDAIIACADRLDGDLEIIAQGPLTNLALALRKDPNLPRKIRRLWIMGGANNALGNITPAAEFNFYVDPEAAHAVLRGGFRTVLVPWDVCINDGILMAEEIVPIQDVKSTLSEFYLAVNRAAWNFMRTHSETGGIDGIAHPDSIMMAMAIDEALILERGHYFVDVEYEGRLTRGYSVVDLRSVLDESPNAEVVLKADKATFKEMLLRLLKG